MYLDQKICTMCLLCSGCIVKLLLLLRSDTGMVRVRCGGIGLRVG